MSHSHVPHIVKQWLAKSPDFETMAVLFADDFITPMDDAVKGEFQFFQSISKNLFPLSLPQVEQIRSSLAFIILSVYLPPNTALATNSTFLINIIFITLFPLTEGWHSLLRTLLTTVILVPLMGIMLDFLKKWVGEWLYKYYTMETMIKQLHWRCLLKTRIHVKS